MTLQLADRVRETTTTTGTGTVTLAGAATGCTTFTSAITTGNPVYYVIAAQDGSAWEVGQGVLSTTSTLTRETVFRSSNSNTLVSFSAGTKDVFLDFPAVLAQCIPLPYGDGSDGDVTLPASTTTLTRDMHYRNLTFVAASVINTAGYWIYVSGTLDISACTAAARIYVTGTTGSNGSTNQPGAGGYNTAQVRNCAGGTGGPAPYYGSTTGGATSGAAGMNSAGWGGRGGAGGPGTSAAGGPGGLGGSVGAFPYHNVGIALSAPTLAGGGGGGGGGGHATTTANAGGGGGQGAPGIRICAEKLTRASTNAVGTVVSTGGNGGQASIDATSGSSGGGGGGGAVLLVVGELAGTSCTNWARSIGGNGLTNGGDGVGAYGGIVSLINLGTGAETSSGPTANSTTTGGTTSLTV